jgi:hypothetical protein
LVSRTDNPIPFTCCFKKRVTEYGESHLLTESGEIEKMKKNRNTVRKGSALKKLSPFIMALIMVPMFSACGMHYNIRGKVINAQTEQPVEGAVVAIHWLRYKLGPPGLPTPKEYYGTTERLTDVQGGFTIPKYTFGTPFMGVYKKGYVCWSSDIQFNPQGKTGDEMYVHRLVKVKNGMVVKLEPRGGNFPAVGHAYFVYMDVRGQLWVSAPSLFDKATSEEAKIYWEQP